MEIQILNWINENLHGSGFINNIFKYITYLGEVGIVWLITAIVLLCFKKTRRGGFILLVGYGATVVLSHFILKNIINRPRPFTESASLKDFIVSLGLEVSDTSSFPSTHTFISFCSATILTFVYKKKGAWSFIPASLIAISRVFLCAHYPTDVLGGMVLGSLTGVGVTILTNLILNKFFNYLDKRKLAKAGMSNNSQTVTDTSISDNQSSDRLISDESQNKIDAILTEESDNKKDTKEIVSSEDIE